MASATNSCDQPTHEDDTGHCKSRLDKRLEMKRLEADMLKTRAAMQQSIMDLIRTCVATNPDLCKDLIQLARESAC